MRLLPRSSFSVLLLIAAGGCASGGLSGSVGLERVATAIGPACSPAQRGIVDAALAEGRLRIGEAIRFMRGRPGDPHIRRWFGDAPAKLVLATLQATNARMMQPGGFSVHCNDPKACSDGQLGYARTEGSLIGVCPPFFLARDSGIDSRFGILLHEISHLAAGTVDHAYQPRGATLLAKRDARRAARNADSYEYFVETLPR